jgi:hypothetical protein
MLSTGGARAAALLAAGCGGTALAFAQGKAQTWPTMQTPQGVPSNRPADGATRAILNYQHEHVVACSTRRDLQGSDDSLEGADWNYQPVTIRDGRKVPVAPTLHKSGFELIRDPKVKHVDYYTEDEVTSTYYKECEDLMKRVTGASFVKAFDHNVRCDAGRASGRKLVGGNSVQAPASLVHGDYTADSAPRRFKLLGEPPKLNDALKEKLGETPLVDASVVDAALNGHRRYCLINIWRPIRPVQTKPLACADASTVVEEDLITFSIHYADRVGENYFAKWRPRHDWVFFPDMVPDETLFIKQWDSHGDMAPSRPKAAAGTSTFALHSAFADPHSSPGAPDRESIEVRLVVVY